MEVPHEQRPTGGSANACTNDPEKLKANPTSEDFAEALVMIARLAMSDLEKAEVVRRLLGTIE